VSRALKSLALFAALVVIVTIGRHEIDAKSTTTTTSSTTSTTTTTTAPATTTTFGSTCAGGDFTGVFNEGEGAAGTITASVTLTKSTAGTCTLKGWPLLSLQDTTGAVLSSTTIDEHPGDAPIHFPAAQANLAPAAVTLSHGSTVSFSLAYSDVPTSSAACPTARTISVQIAKGGSTTTITPSYPIQPCNRGTVWVSPFY
jgi:hypothetical protein